MFFSRMAPRFFSCAWFFRIFATQLRHVFPRHTQLHGLQRVLEDINNNWILDASSTFQSRQNPPQVAASCLLFFLSWNLPSPVSDSEPRVLDPQIRCFLETPMFFSNLRSRNGTFSAQQVIRSQELRELFEKNDNHGFLVRKNDGKNWTGLTHKYCTSWLRAVLMIYRDDTKTLSVSLSVPSLQRYQAIAGYDSPSNNPPQVTFFEVK